MLDYLEKFEKLEVRNIDNTMKADWMYRKEL